LSVHKATIAVAIAAGGLFCASVKIRAGEACSVVAPALIPLRAADRVKTDRHDAISQAQLHRAGELPAIWEPDAAPEAMRDQPPDKCARQNKGLERDASSKADSNSSHPALEHRRQGRVFRVEAEILGVE
jgi:hypothetical protein